MTTYNLTAADIREIAETSGLAHAEMVLENAESQIGRDALTEARDELRRIERETYGDEVA